MYGTIGPRGAEKEHDALADGEFRGADDHAAKAAQFAARNAKLQRVTERAFQIAVDFQRHERFDRSPVVGPPAFDGHDAAARNRARLVREFAEIGGDDDRRARLAPSPPQSAAAVR